MAEDNNADEKAKEGMSPLIKNGVMLGVAMMVPAILALVIFNFFLKPKLAVEPEEENVMLQVDAFPMEMTEFKFEEQRVSVQTNDPEMVAPLLLAQITFMCQDSATAMVVESKQSLFAAMILKFHQGKTRVELNDPLVQNSIREQIKQQANILLKRLNSEVDLRVLDVLHLQFTIVDL